MAPFHATALVLLLCPLVSSVAAEFQSGSASEVQLAQAPDFSSKVLSDMDSVPDQLPLGEDNLVPNMKDLHEREGKALMMDRELPMENEADQMLPVEDEPKPTLPIEDILKYAVHEPLQHVEKSADPRELSVHEHAQNVEQSTNSGVPVAHHKKQKNLREASDPKRGGLQEHAAEFLKALRDRRLKHAANGDDDKKDDKEEDGPNIPDLGPFLSRGGTESQKIIREKKTESMASGGSPLDLATRNKKGPDYVVRPQGPNTEVYQNIAQNADRYLDSMNNYNMSPKYSVDQTIMLPPNVDGKPLPGPPNWKDNEEPKPAKDDKK